MMAGEYLVNAIALEPDYAAAHAWYAYWHIFLVGQGWADDPRAMMEEAGELAERAVVLDPFDARALTIAGHVRAFLHRRLHEAASLHERALSLNPNLAMAWALSAITYAYMGEPEEAERRNNRYKKLSPLDPHAFFFDAFFILIHLMKRDYEMRGGGGTRGERDEPVVLRDVQAVSGGAGASGADAGSRGGAAAAAGDRAGLHRRALHRDVAAGARERPRSLRGGTSARRRAGDIAEVAEQLQRQEAQ